jgi:hypothetical protein
MTKYLQYALLITSIAAMCSLHSARTQADQRRQDAAQDDAVANPYNRCFESRMHASWATYYRTLSELKAHASIGVLGNIVGLSNTSVKTGEPAYRMITIQVERAIHKKSNSGEVPDTITFMQTGGEVDGIGYFVDDDPLFQNNERVILFFDEYQPGNYRIAGGPTGRFTVDDLGNVNTIARDGVPVAPGTSVDTFANM